MIKLMIYLYKKINIEKHLIYLEIFFRLCK